MSEKLKNLKFLRYCFLHTTKTNNIKIQTIKLLTIGRFKRYDYKTNSTPQYALPSCRDVLFS